MSPTSESGNWSRIPTDDVPMGPQRPPKAPFPASCELITDLNTPPPSVGHPCPLPGHVRIDLNNSMELSAFLLRELYATDLDVIVSKTWGMSAKSKIISPLHFQQVQGRKIYVTEDPRLHLVWLHDRIFVKPLPKYLMSHRFWVDYLLDDSSALSSGSRQAIRKAALGLLRSYYYLIAHESDFAIACAEGLRLLPPDITWDQFCGFSSRFKDIEDCHVWRRYHFGELSLSYLNLHAKLFLRKLQFERIPGIYSSRFYGALLFGFAGWTLVLGAMQVTLAVESLVTEASWDGFWEMCRWFSMITLVGCILLAIAVGFLLLNTIAKEWIDALKSLCSARKYRKSEMSQA